MPEVSKGKTYINQKKNVPIGIDCNLLNIPLSMSKSHSTMLPDSKILLCTKKYSKVRQKTTKCCTTKYTKYCTILLRTTKYYKVLIYSKITKYDKVLHKSTQYFSVLQRITKYYKIILKSNTTIWQNTAQYYSALKTSTPHYKFLQSTTLSTTKYYTIRLCTTK